MAQKINPKGFRLGITENYSTQWFTKNPSTYSKFIFQDTKIRQYLAQIYPNLVDIIIERQLARKSAFSTIEGQCNVKVILHTNENLITLSTFSPYSRNILKMKGSNKIRKMRENKSIEILTEELQTSLPFSENINLSIKIDKNDATSRAVALDIQNAILIAQKSNNLKFKVILKRIKQNLLKKKSIQGFKVQLSGRSAGSLMAGQESVYHGKLPRQTIRVPIDYSAFDVPTKTGLVGVKIWINSEKSII